MTNLPDIWLLRHGETTWNRAGRLQGSLDAPPTALGRVQAARQGALLRAHVPAVRVLCSPQGRARVTAALAGLRPRISDNLRELAMGEWEGMHLSDVPQGRGVGWKFNAPSGEPLADITARVDRLLGSLSEPTILVTHGVTGLLIRARATGARDLDALSDRQGVVYHLSQGFETVWT